MFDGHKHLTCGHENFTAGHDCRTCFYNRCYNDHTCRTHHHANITGNRMLSAFSTDIFREGRGRDVSANGRHMRLQRRAQTKRRNNGATYTVKFRWLHRANTNVHGRDRRSPRDIQSALSALNNGSRRLAEAVQIIPRYSDRHTLLYP